MKIFLSHALIDKKLAQLVKELIENVSLGLTNIWLSSALDGLKPGDNLWNEVHQNLSDSDMIIALLTPNSLQRPWILYESGFVAGNKKANVIPMVFCIDKNDLPLPLSAYVIYKGDELEDLSQLLIQIVTKVAPKPNKYFIIANASEFVENSKDINVSLTEVLMKSKEQINEGSNNEAIQIIDKLKASEIFHQKLSDENVKSIQIISYSNEVESGSIDKYRVKGIKNIEIFKRSVLSDLIEEQKNNLVRIINESNLALWDKSTKIINSTKTVELAFKDSDEVKIFHYFYDFPPIKRAYIFDDKEALVSYFETKDALNTNRSIYKGMGDSKSLWVSRATSFGTYVLDELKEYVNNLKIHSRNWAEEIEHLTSERLMSCLGQTPCINLKAFLFDVDGIIYDSMKSYEVAWCKGFQTIGLEIPKEEPYIHEGNSSRNTVIELVKQYQNRVATEKEIETVISERDIVLTEFDNPVIFKGCKELIAKLIKRGFKVGFVTSSSRKDLKTKMVMDFDNIINEDFIITGNDVQLKKPYPVPYLVALEKLNIKANEAIVIENSPLGTLSAKRAGIPCLCVNTGPLMPEILIKYGGWGVFKSIEDLNLKIDKVIEIMNKNVL
jgi:HAD superfamily hydrolase (TIGR01509 family)